MASEQLRMMGESGSTYKIEAVVSVDERGQMVLPKDLRARAGIKPGEKLALISWEKDGQVCCMSLVKRSRLVLQCRCTSGTPW